jgi:hypothetical protein
MAKKCVHKGCGKAYENDDDECVYHPGPPVFHEGQKGGCAQLHTPVAGFVVNGTAQAGSAANPAC